IIGRTIPAAITIHMLIAERLDIALHRKPKLIHIVVREMFRRFGLRRHVDFLSQKGKYANNPYLWSRTPRIQKHIRANRYFFGSTEDLLFISRSVLTIIKAS